MPDTNSRHINNVTEKLRLDPIRRKARPAVLSFPSQFLHFAGDTMAPVRYDLAVASWRNSDVISIVSASGSPIAYFPLDFIMKGGQPEWTYVILAIQQITDQAIGTQWGLQDTDGQVVSAEAIPRAGKFIYGTQGE